MADKVKKEVKAEKGDVAMGGEMKYAGPLGDKIAQTVDDISIRGASGQRRKARHLLELVKKAPKKWSDTARGKLSERMKLMQKAREGVLVEWAKKAVGDRYFKTESGASAAWEAAVGKYKSAFGGNSATRDQKLAIGYRSTGGRGKFSPFTVVRGTLTGGMTSKGEDYYSAALGRACYGIPATTGTRQLITAYGKYEDPALFPACRLVKFIRGRWGAGLSANDYEKV